MKIIVELQNMEFRKIAYWNNLQLLQYKQQVITKMSMSKTTVMASPMEKSTRSGILVRLTRL